MGLISEHGRESIRKIDAAAESCKKTLPDDYAVGICQAAASITMQISDLEDSKLATVALIAICKNLYKAGYVDGMKETETRLGIGRG